MTTTPAANDLDARARALYSWQARIDALTAWDALAAEYTNVLNDRQLGWAEAQEAQHALTAARKELAKTRAELDEIKAKGSPGVMHEVDRAFYDLTIKERDAARHDAEYWKGKYEAGAMDKLAAEANPATTAEPADCTCATWREETPFGLQAVIGPDATCLLHGEKTTAEPADEPKAAATNGWPKSQDCSIGAHRPCDRDYCRCDCHAQAEPAAG